MKIREALALAPVIPVLTVQKLEHAAPLARALYAGGLKVLEITLRTAVALDVIEAMRIAVPEAVVGAGTLLRPEDFARAGGAGAQFADPGSDTAAGGGSRHGQLPAAAGSRLRQ